MESESTDDLASDTSSITSTVGVEITNDDEVRGYGSADDVSSVVDLPGSFQKAKTSRTGSRRYAKAYNEAYVKLFNESHHADESEDALLDSQLGSVVWTASEKAIFFNALSRKGRRDISGIAKAIGTKSEVEVIDYLLRLKDAEAHRQMYADYAKNLSCADIKAAVEIDTGLEELLEDAADALAVAQDNYDYKQAQNSVDRPWFIDPSAAEELKARADALSGGESEQEAEPDNVDVLGLFHFDKLLELSSRVFMNMPYDSAFDHWHWLEESHSDVPVITMDAAQTLFDLVKGFTQRVLQSAVFLAESRLRSTTTTEYAPIRCIKFIDVVAALQILGLPPDSFEYWANYPKRSGQNFVLGIHDNRDHDRKTLNSQEIDEVLSVRVSRGRRRSLSSMMSASSRGEDSEAENTHEVQPRDAGTAREESHEVEVIDDSEVDEGSEEGSKADTASGELGPTHHYRRKRRHQMIEEAEDEYLEKLDHVASRKESAQLREMLGFSPLSDGEDEALGGRPKRPRKTRDELSDWTDLAYQTPWEQQIELPAP